jgi:phosphatidylserine decarboxylase
LPSEQKPNIKGFATFAPAMTIHKEGYTTLIVSALVLFALNWCVDHFFPTNDIIRLAVFLPSIIVFLIILQFFRSPARKIRRNDNQVLAPADGKVVVIEETQEDEILKDRRIQVSIFMSPFNVHVNRYPVSGQVVYSRYHPGKYLVAWHPKSSEENERTTVVIENGSKTNIPSPPDCRRAGPSYRLLSASGLHGKAGRADGLY